MARKSATDLKSQNAIVEEAIEDFQSLSEMKYEIAKEAFDAQTLAMRDVINTLLKTLRVHAKDIIEVQLGNSVVPVQVEKKYVDYNLLYIVMDMLKNLALFDIKVFEYQFPPNLCVKCEAQIDG